MLDRAHISGAIATIRTQLTACGRSGVSGIIKVHVTVAPDGAVRHLELRQRLDPDVDRCVVGHFGRLRFPATDQGATFLYPVVY